MKLYYRVAIVRHWFRYTEGSISNNQVLGTQTNCSCFSALREGHVLRSGMEDLYDRAPFFRPSRLTKWLPSQADQKQNWRDYICFH